MLIDTSAIVAILFGEPGAAELVAAIASAPARRIGAATLVEAAAVMHAKKGPSGEIALDALLERLEIEVVMMTVEAAALARAAYRRYGKGVGAPGVLNFGDCLAYGAAKALDEPLLFKGEDFPKTDIQAVAW